MKLSYYFDQLDEIRDRISREAASKADRLIAEMNNFEPLTLAEQRHYWLNGQEPPERRPYSEWEIRRIILPQLIAELKALA